MQTPRRPAAHYLGKAAQESFQSGGGNIIPRWPHQPYTCRIVICRLLAMLLIAFAVQGQQAGVAGADPPGKTIREYLVLGTVIWANPASASISIRGMNLIGNRSLQVKTFRAESRSALAHLHPGDRIMAVFSREDGMLHSLRRVLRRKPA
jgi:hypothetical protein